MTIKKVYFRFFVYGLNAAICVLLLIIVLGLPFALKSLYNEVVGNANENHSQSIIKSKKTNDFTEVEIFSKEIDPVNKNIRMKLTGYHHCDNSCGKYITRLHISDFYLRSINKNLPSSIAIDIPKNSIEFEREIILPVSGDIFKYPFDKYSVNIAIAIEVIEDNHSTFLTQGNMNLTVLTNEHIPRLHKSLPRFSVDLNEIATYYPVSVALSHDYERPFYIKYIVSLLVILLIITTAATILLSEFSKLITGAAGIILGVWGTRSLLLGNLPADVTIIDIILTLIVVGTLISVAIKSVIHTNKIWRNI